MQYKLEIMKKQHYGYRVVNQNGESELGTWHIADFAHKEHAEFFVNSLNALHGAAND